MAKTTGWVDIISLIVSLAILGLVAVWTVQSGFVAGVLETNRSMTWQFIRSSGLTAYVLFAVSTLWGVALSSKVVKDWSPGPLSMLMHASVSWLGVVFAALHALLLLFDQYVPYHPVEILVPFIGPYRPGAVGLGTITFWLMLLVALSFAVKRRLGHRRWKLLHYTSYAGFFTVTAHALLAGTDAVRLGFLILFALSGLSVVALIGYRIRVGKPGKARAH